MAAHRRAGRGSRVPAVRPGRTDSSLRKKLPGTAPDDGELPRPQMGTHLHHSGGLRRSLLRFIPPVLLHKLRRSLLAVDAYTAQLRGAGIQLRIPPQERQPLRNPILRRPADVQRHCGLHSPWRGRRHVLLRRRFHRAAFLPARPGISGNFPVGADPWS